MTGLAVHCHIRPWEIDNLSIDEFYAFCDTVDAIQKAQEGS